MPGLFTIAHNSVFVASPPRSACKNRCRKIAIALIDSVVSPNQPAVVSAGSSAARQENSCSLLTMAYMEVGYSEAIVQKRAVYPQEYFQT